ncbi:bifunctional phosphopantothenoylcysteine decarboxylase/phosphopantothenate--cysteine ligase CoaBC [Candidatus Berkiella aquae]|uniref:Coenzyme A biosynthesis bifunctional protein CoaBC n=1 Tax=Candidatus Berkiella aquae TaxID=295108 RepID=A0A0Q9YVM7_9GAMM|nr:bifunctional phosphopantothenoylcysteine decarboxylase/phosphopantothenate--cysteine ligase CoaBC [Candidatus Berkiella aquae]MCS5710050.1 bifunctional phosphopantothenoylcysteine decarboxylase/phosphopantothenate--cysteine ligase CoaBC [Candidatus Berkiella aquae]
MMQIKRWLVGITGGIAAYKIPELVRLLKKQDCEVRVVLSQGAKAFVTPLTLQAVSANPVYSELLDADFEAAMGHIELARWAQGVLIAPLSANRLAALAHGFADDLLTTLCLATTAPLYVAPAMNQQMWQHPATKANLEKLKARGVQILGPDWGQQACGEVGYGRMLEPQAIMSALAEHHHLSYSESILPLQGLQILITAGPTREAIDPVRYLSNRSSGKMGIALAKAAIDLGAKVTLVHGPIQQAIPEAISTIAVTSANEMLAAVESQVHAADIFISAAAVADFRPTEIAQQKIKKGQQTSWELTLVPNPDILAIVAARVKRPFCVGFAAETEQFENHAKKKLIDKRIDLIALNDVSRHDIGFDANENAMTVMSHTATHHLSKESKYEVAIKLLHLISEYYHAKNKT